MPIVEKDFEPEGTTRKYPRVKIEFQASYISGKAFIDAQMINIGMGGFAFHSNEAIPIDETAMVAFTIEDEGIPPFEINALCHIRHCHREADTEEYLCGLEFDALTLVEKKVLDAYIALHASDAI